ncbi:MAG: hypothetical protein L3J69_16485 [Desulfobacula sp.]|nr:hypothetical protein [Desulfobacula sp.]
MNCKDFENWLLSVERTSDSTVPNNVTEHLLICADCEQIYLLDTGLETQINGAFARQDVPIHLEALIESDLDHATGPPFLTIKKITGLVAAIGILVAFFYLNLNTPFRFQNLQQLSENAVLQHLNGDFTMTFDASRLDQTISMLSKELKFKVILPDLTARGYILLGGRICAFGKCRAAYLFYKNQEKVCSLFIMDYDRLEFEMADGSRFNNILKGCKTDIWKENGQVYAMVY